MRNKQGQFIKGHGFWTGKKRGKMPWLSRVDNGITLCVDCHILFHKIYGQTHNTFEQLKEFLFDEKLKTLFKINSKLSI